MGYTDKAENADLYERIERLALNASEYFVAFYESGCSGPDRTQAWLVKRIVADVAAIMRIVPGDAVQPVYDEVIERMRYHLGVDGPTKGVDPEAGIAYAIKAGPATLDKSDCGKDLTDASSYGGSATFPGGATITACVEVKDKKPVGGSVTGGWKCSF